MAAAAPGSHCYFYEDEVYRVNARGQVGFGLVLDNCEPSSSDSDNEPPLQRGDLRVVWHPSGKERVVSDKAVGLADRALLPGDVVRRMIKGKDTQRGYCRDIIVTGAVQVVGTNLVLPAVPSERLHPLAEFTADLAVCLDSWVGTSKIVHSKLRLISSDGSRLEFPDVNLCLLEDCLQRRRCGGRGGIEHQAANEFYPGQTVVGPLGALDHAAWLHVTKEMEAARKHKMREHKFTVECVETESVGVHWQCRALGEQPGGGPPQQPRFLVEGEDLKRLRLLNLFEPCTVQVGAKNFLTLSTEDTFCTKAQWKKTQNKIYRALRKQARPPRSNKSKETKEPKEIIKEASVQTLDANITSNHNFRTPSKSKKRLSAFNRDGKIFCYHNIQTQTSIDSKCGSTKDVEIASKDDPNQQHKMDVDILIMGDKTTKIGGNQSNVNVKVSCLDANVCNPNEQTNVNTALASILPQRSDDGSHLDVPDKACNGKCTSSDRSCSPECVDTSEKQKKIRKSRVSSANNSRSNSPAVFNGDHKTTEVRNDINDSDSWGNTSSDEATDTDSCGTWSSQCSSSTNNSMASGRGKKSPHLVTKFLKGKRLKKTARRNSNVPQPKPEDRVVVETLCTKSKANVVWQDGTIEFGIPSTELYPIHHLDGQECFPGDFVISGATSESSSSHRDYGVVQKVDHYGRTAIVKWFRTYTSCQEPIPQFVAESEVSVYDLKDHPDFQYRPGTVVIRVANFIGTEASCTAGQVMDNFPSGHVKVWWVDGHTSMCWPQDLYKVGEYDSDEGDIWADEESSSDDSWETQSSMGDSSGESHKGKKSIDKDDDNGEECILLPDVDTDASAAALLNSSKGELPKVPRGLEPRAAAHIEKGLNAMARMEEILSQNPSLQTHEIMRKLLTLYKDCRFLDRLMGTSFFHEDHFQGLLERVRERGGSRESGSGNAGVRRVQNQVLRLFSRDDSDGPEPFIPMSMIEKDVSEEDANIPLDLSNTLISETNQKTAINTSLPQVEINNLNAKESTETSKSSDVKSNCNLGDNDDIKMPTIVSTDGNSNLKESLTDACTTTPSKDVSSKYGALSPPNDNSVSKFGTLSPISDGSLSKYGTPVGSIGDLANQNDRSPNCTMDKNKNEDSGIDSQSLSISQSANNASINCESSIAGSKTLSKDSSKKSEVLSKTSSATSSSDSQLSNRNVCQKLCSLITKQLMKAFAEMNRQFDTMVITMEDESNENNTDGNTSTDIKIDEVKNVIETDENALNIENTKETPVENTLNTTSEFGEGFQVLESAPTSHHFRLSLLQPSEPRAFHQAVAREIKLLKSDLPPGVWVRGYEDRMDLLSIMIAGPAKTPYEDGLFLFDVQLGGEYPRAPPLCHYLSYCSDRLNPNLYEDGKVCVSLLGTWSGRGVEVWRRDSSLLQVIVSLQGLILCAEPYFNEAGYDKQKGSQQGSENSRMYNEMVLLKLVQSLTKMVLHPPDIFKAEIFAFQSRHASGLCDRLVHWMIMSEEHNSHHPGSPSTTESVISDTSKFDMQPPEYPLIPASRGFCLTLRSSLDSYRNALTKAGISFEKNL